MQIRGAAGEGGQQRLVIGLQLERPTLKAWAEMFDTWEGSQQHPGELVTLTQRVGESLREKDSIKIVFSNPKIVFSPPKSAKKDQNMTILGYSPGLQS